MSIITLPGLIDPHVHLRDPGQTEKEDFLTGTSAALAGGYTTLLDMPNNKIPITTKEKLDEKIAIAKKKIVCDVGFYFGSIGDNLKEFVKVKNKVFGLKLYLNETTGNFLIDRKAVETTFSLWPSDLPILLHAEDDAVAFIIGLLKNKKRPVHFCHISTAEDLKQIIAAKQENLPVTCGVTPHHLFLTDEDVKHLGPFAKVKPPLRSKTDINFLWEHIQSIDVIETDHAPHTKAEKESDLPPSGVPNLETTLPLLLTAVSEKRLLVDDVMKLCAENPAKIFGIKIDQETKIEVDIEKSYTISNRSLHTKCGWSPYAGRRVKGKVEKVYIRGTKVFENDKVLVKPGWGRVLKNE